MSTGTSADNGTQRASGGPEPMDIGSMVGQPLTAEQKEHLRKNKGCFYCWKTNAGHLSFNCPEKRRGFNWGKISVVDSCDVHSCHHKQRTQLQFSTMAWRVCGVCFSEWYSVKC